MRVTPRKALFTPNGAKECPINPDSISRERTTEIIDASEGGDPDRLKKLRSLYRYTLVAPFKKYFFSVFLK